MLRHICAVAAISGFLVSPSLADPQAPVTPPPVIDEASEAATPPRQDPAHPVTQPPYPPASAVAREEGAVILEFMVHDDGTVDPISVRVSESSGHALLDAAAIAEAATWRFIPATRGGKSVAAPHRFRIVFEAQEQECGLKIERKPDHPYKITQAPYPDSARASRQEGGVDLKFIVQADGFVNPCSIVIARSSGFPLLDQAAAREAAFNWRFRPATLHGQPIPSQHGFRVEFSLKP
jgi:TonB family protein